MSRSFYIGENVKEDDIHAKYESGVLKLTFQKKKRKNRKLKKEIHCHLGITAPLNIE